MSWRTVWESRISASLTPTLADLIALDGFDQAMGLITPQAWQEYAALIAEQLQLRAPMKLLDVGCGAGALLLPLSEAGVVTYGLDYSRSLLEVAKRALPAAQLLLADAREEILHWKHYFDAVLANSLFHYLPDIHAAERVLSHMHSYCKPEGRIAVLDVLDAASIEAYHAARKKSGAGDAHNGAYQHLALPKQFFVNNAGNRDVVFAHQSIRGYGNADFRYNVYYQPLRG